MVVKKNINPPALEAHQRLIMSHPMVILVIDPNDGRIVDANHAAAQFYGWSTKKLQQMNISEINTLPVEAIQAETKHVSQKQRNYFDFQHRLADGQICEVEVHSLPIPWNGQTMLCSMISDVTERKKMEQALRESELKYRQLFELELDARLIVDAQSGNIIDMNSSAVSLYGYTREELIGMRHVDISAAPEEAWTTSVFNTDAGEIPIPLRYHRKKDGAVFPVEINEVSVGWKDRTILIATIHDITERKRAEEALRECEEKNRAILQATSDGFWRIDGNGRILDVNEAYCEMLGYTRNELLGLHVSDIEATESPEETAARIARIHEKGSEVFEDRQRRKDGNVFAVEVSVTLLPGSDGHMVGFCRDITERRRHEMTLKKSYERRRQKDLMNELIQCDTPSKQAVFDSAYIMGAKLMAPFSFFLIVIEEYQGKPNIYWRDHVEQYQLMLGNILDTVEEDLRICWESSEGIGVICFETDDSAMNKDKQMKLAEQLYSKIAVNVPEATISLGIAEPAENMADVGDRYYQAHTAVMTGRKVRPELKTYHYMDMGVFQLLSCFNDENRVEAYVERTLGNLLTYDKRKRADFLQTLEIILMSDNLTKGAEKLSIHYKTLLFRKHRLEKILGVSFDDFSSRMAILTALYLLKMREN